jgi:hypothetical protein
VRVRAAPVEGFDGLVRNKVAALVGDALEIERFERQRANANLAKWLKADRMHVLNGELDPESGSRVFRAIDAEVDAAARATRSLARSVTASPSSETNICSITGRGVTPPNASLSMRHRDLTRSAQPTRRQGGG